MKYQCRILCIAVVLAVFVIVLFPTVAFLQSTNVGVTVTSVDAEKFPTISVTMSVADVNGVGVPRLTGASFQILEDMRPANVISTTTIPNAAAPIAVCLVIDISGSMTGDRIAGAKLAAQTFVKNMGSKDKTCILAFSDRVDLSAPIGSRIGRELDFTGDQAVLLKLIDGLEADKNPGTPLYDAALKAVRAISTQPPGTRAVILFTDGKDERLSPDGTSVLQGSESTKEAAIAAAKAAHIRVFTIGLGDQIDHGYLQYLAGETGTKYEYAAKPGDLGDLFLAIGKQLKTQYQVQYNSTLFPDGKDHTLDVKAQTPSGEANTRTSFFLDLPETPFIRLYYKEGDKVKELREGQNLIGTTLIAPEIAITTTKVISFTEFSLSAATFKPYTATVAPWNFSWDTGQITAGGYTLTVHARDNKGGEGKAQVSVVILPCDWRCKVEDLPVWAKASVIGVALLAFLGIVFMVARPRPPSWIPTPVPTPPYVSQPTIPTAPASSPIQPYQPLDAAPPPPISDNMSPVLRASDETARMAHQTSPSEQPPPMETVIMGRPVGSFAFLVMQKGDHPGKEFPLHQASTTIGRAGTNDIVVDDPTVGRQQAKIKSEGKILYLYDLAATNPTRVNGESVKGRLKLADNDCIQIGSSEFIFKQVQAAS